LFRQKYHNWRRTDGKFNVPQAEGLKVRPLIRGVNSWRGWYSWFKLQENDHRGGSTPGGRDVFISFSNPGARATGVFRYDKDRKETGFANEDFVVHPKLALGYEWLSILGLGFVSGPGSQSSQIEQRRN
jgi:hypothetical protein